MIRRYASLSVVALSLLEFAACTSSTRDFGTGGSGGFGGSGDAQAGSGGRVGAAGVSGRGPSGGASGARDEAGAAGAADPSEAGSDGAGLEIAAPHLTSGKTYIPYTGSVTASGGSSYEWTLVSGVLPAGLSLQSTKTATLKIVGTPTEAGQFPITLGVSDGSSSATIDLNVAVSHAVLFAADRETAGRVELFSSEIGAASAPAPVRVNAPLPAGGSISSYAWSPDGSKVLYLAAQSSGGTEELWVASLSDPGAAQRVSAAGVIINQMVWLRTGNIAAYITNNGDAYLVDLSGAAPGASKLAVSGPTVPDRLIASPNGNSLLVYATIPNAASTAISYVTWTGSAPKVVTLEPGAPTNEPSFSFDGKYVAAQSAGGAKLWDVSLPVPTADVFGFGVAFQWSPRENRLFYSDRDTSSDPAAERLFRADFSSGALTPTVLIPSSACDSLLPAPWSPDGKNALFVCAPGDVRAVSDVANADAGTDFSLLPSGYFSNSFTGFSRVNWSPDSRWVALLADRDVDGQFDLNLVRWSAPGIIYKPHANSISPGVAAWAFAQNSKSIAFVGTISPRANPGLYLSQLTASAAPSTATLASAPESAIVENDLQWLPGSRVIAYRATVSGTDQLFALTVTADGSADAVTAISGASGSGVTSYQLAPVQ